MLQNIRIYLEKCGISDTFSECQILHFLELPIVKELVISGCLLVMKVTKVMKKSCIFISGHESHEKVMNFWQNY